MELNIYHLYPDVLNLYGDRGNVLCMQRRLEWRGMQANIVNVPIGTNLDAKTATLSSSAAARILSRRSFWTT